MPRTLTFPSPSTHVCPVCDVRLSELPCSSCGADLERPESVELLQIDQELHRLTVLRGVLVERLLATLPAPELPDVQDVPTVPVDAPPPPPPARSSAAAGRHGASDWSVAEILVGLGGLSLVAAVVVFVAVAWSDLAAWAQGGLLFAATGAVLAGAIGCRRRDLTATGESLGMVGLALGLADVQVVRTALSGALSGRVVWSTGLALVAAAAVSTGRSVRLRGMVAAGAAIAFVPLPLAAAGLEAETAVLWAFGAQALIGAAVLGRLAPTSLERPVVAVGVALSWASAAVFGLGVALGEISRDVYSVPTPSIALLALLAVASIVVGSTQRIRSLGAAGMLLAFAPVVIVVVGLGTLSMVAAALVAQCALGVAVSALLRRSARSHDERILASVLDVGAAMSAVGAVCAAAVLGLADWLLGSATVSASLAAVGTLLALAAIGVAGAVYARWERSTAAVVLVASVGAVFAAAWLSRIAATTDDRTTVVMLTGAVVALICAALAEIDVRRSWTMPMTAAAAGVGVLAMMPLAVVGAAAVALGEVAVSAVDAAPGSSLVDHLGRSMTIDVDDLPSAATVSQLFAVLAVGLAGVFRNGRWGRWTVATTAVAGLVAVPLVLGASILVTAVLYGAATASALGRLVAKPDDAPTVVAGTIAASLLLAVSAASPGLMIVATVLVTGGLALLARRSLEAGSTTASLWVSAALLSGLGGVTIDALRLGSGGSVPALVALSAAAIGSIVAPAIERWRRDEETGAAACADVVVSAALVVAMLATRSFDAASGAVAVIGLVAGAHSLRPTRRPLLGVAVAAIVVLTWMRLAAADVELLEAYTAPLAGALLLCGALVRPDAHSSWVRKGSGLFAALAPTTIFAMSEGELTRTVIVVLGAAAVALWGAFEREQASLAIGGVALSAMAVRHLGPVANELPRYVVFAVVGVALLAAGATFEQRRRDLRRAREAFGRLR